MTLPSQHFINAYASPIPYPNFYSKGPALCTQIDSDMYFPEGQAAITNEYVALKKLCFECPYRAECLEWAVVNREDGIWGGTNNAERAAMRNGYRSRTDTMRRAGVKKK